MLSSGNSNARVPLIEGVRGDEMEGGIRDLACEPGGGTAQQGVPYKFAGVLWRRK